MAEWLRELSVGQWFETGGEPFEIVGIDIPAELVLVQHYDGTLEDFDFETWMTLAASPCAPPEDYSGALDIGPEDYAERDEPPARGHWDSPADLVESYER
ncbi:hypothetical protein SAMN04488038_107111 [Solimonas aquatica]|uniref:Uncharacterized protein n=1 Tax=Solimonas aquatica TaxID=489703 RepID=A0A1H9GKU3_9GAMM|nr:DUF6763 family protein [Solimonas aquatica]SEQ50644.1 hypothetical protein SAMN04488038_107111 [Solimonas aquatica]